MRRPTTTNCPEFIIAKAILLTIALVLASCAGVSRTHITPPGVAPEIVCKPKSGAKYPKVAIAGSDVYVATAMGTNRHRLDDRKQLANNLVITWSTDPRNSVELKIYPTGNAMMTSSFHKGTESHSASAALSECRLSK